MGSKQDIGVAERLVEGLAATALGAAIAFALANTAPLAGPALVVAALAAALVAAAGAWLALDRVGPTDRAAPDFMPVDFAEAIGAPCQSPELTDQSPELPELLLDEPIERCGPESRVVQLFGEDPAAIREPGVLIARIEDHLASQRRAPGDASAALHAALADIRRSLG